MARLWRRWRKEISRRLTIMLIPHGLARPRQISFSLPVLAFLFASWTALTGWAGFLASERVDYWRAQVSSHYLKLKLSYMSKQLNESQAMLDEVKRLETELRAMMGLGSRDAIIQTETSTVRSLPHQALGGPSASDARALEQMLQAPPREISFEEIGREVQALRAEAELRIASVQMLGETISTERQKYNATPNLWPVGGYLTSHYGTRVHPIDGFTESHQGLDIAGPAGSPIRATADGEVTLAGWAGGYGNVVVINHGMGYSTRYGHNRLLLVKRGDQVKRGQTIALMGQTGKATGPHCHYEVWYNGRAVNPYRFLKKHTS